MKPGLFNMLMECQIQSGLCEAAGRGGLLIKKEIIVTIRPEQENSPSTSLLSTYLPALAGRGRRGEGGGRHEGCVRVLPH